MHAARPNNSLRTSSIRYFNKAPLLQIKSAQSPVMDITVTKSCDEPAVMELSTIRYMSNRKAEVCHILTFSRLNKNVKIQSYSVFARKFPEHGWGVLRQDLSQQG